MDRRSFLGCMIGTLISGVRVPATPALIAQSGPTLLDRLERIKRIDIRTLQKFRTLIGARLSDGSQVEFLAGTFNHLARIDDKVFFANSTLKPLREFTVYSTTVVDDEGYVINSSLANQIQTTIDSTIRIGHILESSFFASKDLRIESPSVHFNGQLVDCTISPRRIDLTRCLDNFYVKPISIFN